MIATHHMKIDGRWVLPGEEYEPEQTEAVPEKGPEKAQEAAHTYGKVDAAPTEEPETRNARKARRKA